MPSVDARTQRGHLARRAVAPLAHVPRAEAERGHYCSVVQNDVGDCNRNIRHDGGLIWLPLSRGREQFCLESIVQTSKPDGRGDGLIYDDGRSD